MYCDKFIRLNFYSKQFSRKLLDCEIINIQQKKVMDHDTQNQYQILNEYIF